MLLFPFCGKVTERDYSIFRKLWKTIVGYWLIMLLWMIPIVIIFVIMDIDRSNAADKAINRIKIDSIYWRIFLVCLFLPFLEELAFRLSLKFSKINLTLGLSLFCFYILATIMKELDLHKSIRIIASLLFSILVGVKIWVNNDVVRVFLTRNNMLMISVLCFSFAIIHYNDYNFKSSPHTAVISMIGALFIAYYLSFVRLKFGFAYAVLVHCLHNTLVSLPFIIKSFNS